MGKHVKLPIYIKAKEIQQLVDSLIEFIKESELPLASVEELKWVEDDLLAMKDYTNSIPGLIAAASVSGLPYDTRMEQAVYIRKEVRELQDLTFIIEDLGFKDLDYLNLLHQEIEAFRILFLDWIKSFKLWKYKEEDWGLFNPEGIQIVDENSGHDFLNDDEDDDIEDEDEDEDD